MRPRDVILFFNLCIAQAKDNPKITAQIVRQAEGEYSRLRLRSLADEWQTDYPSLLDFVEILKGRPPQFLLADFSDEDCLAICVRLYDENAIKDDELSRAASSLVNGNAADYSEFRRAIMAAFYRVGLVGLKLENYESVSWSISSRRGVSVSEIGPATRVAVHPCFWRTLGIQEVGAEKRSAVDEVQTGACDTV
jgi:hypothetical protein